MNHYTQNETIEIWRQAATASVRLRAPRGTGEKDMAQKTTTSQLVTIAGREYRLSTDEDREYVEQLAAYVTTRIYQIKREIFIMDPLVFL